MYGLYSRAAYDGARTVFELPLPIPDLSLGNPVQLFMALNLGFVR